MTEQAHRIRRLRWQVRAPGTQAAMGMRAMLRELMPDVEAAVLQAFDAHGLGEAVRYLDRLEVRLRVPALASPQALMQELGSALAHALQQAAAKMQPLPWGMSMGGAPAGAQLGATPLSERGALLCALLALAQQAPNRLLQSLNLAWRERQQGSAQLRLDGRVWRVDEVALAHWQRWLSGANGAGEPGILDDPVGEAERGRTGAMVEELEPVRLNMTKARNHLDESGDHLYRQLQVGSAFDTVQGKIPAASLPHLQPQLMHYLRAGQMGWMQGWAELMLDGRVWRVDEAALAHWHRWLASASGAGELDQRDDLRGVAKQGRTGAKVEGLAPAQMYAATARNRSSEPDDQPSRQSQVRAASDMAPGQTPAARLPHLQAQLMHYLRTGQMDWTLAGLPADQARRQLREAAAHWVELGMWPDAWPGQTPLPDRLGALCRWLSLLDESQRQVVVERHGPSQLDSAAAQGHDAGASGLTEVAAIRASLMALMREVKGASSDHLHALALWLDWQQAGGEAMPDAVLQAWGQAALVWTAGWVEQGPVHDAWRACQQQISASLTQGWAAGGAAISVPHEALPSSDQGVGALGEHESSTAQRQAHDDASLRTSTGASPRPAATPPTSADLTRPAARPIREPVISQGHLIAQAGLVLLHPYLPSCFNVLGLYPTGQRGPIADAMWPRAAAVLHWLAMGDATEVLECDLGLIKLLLGRGEHEALSHGLPSLLPHEREEAAALLQAVLGHWSALKGTSVEGLRQSFLQRPGWLEPLDRAWQLRVQPAAFDMLLGSLPWGLSMVKLPWMDRPMHVEWSAP